MDLMVERVLNEFPVARTEPLSGHPLAALLRDDLADTVAGLVGDSYKVVGSPGQGNWAETPWVSVFEPSVTTTAQRGFYVCYLFRGDGASVYLSLNQGTTEVRERVGGRQYLQVLQDRAVVDRGLLGVQDLRGLQHGRIKLGGSGVLTRGYEAGNIAAISYERGKVPGPEVLAADLARFLDLYVALIEAREATEEGTGEALPEGIGPGEEAQRFRWHRRAERNPRLAAGAKAVHGYTCQVCGFNFEERYGENGKGYIEAHHIVPLAELVRRPDRVVLDPKTDFAVVCANCHRMLHRGAVAPSIEELRVAFSPT